MTILAPDDGHQAQCPWCGEVWGDLWDYSWGGSDFIDIECPICAKPIRLMAEHSVSYSTEKREEARPHG